MKAVNAVVISAMKEEMAPFIKLLDGYQVTEIKSPFATAYHVNKGRSNLILMVTKIGMTACASALGWALSKYDPRAVISIGSAGGLAADSRVNQVIVGSEYLNSGADGTVFGYERGQVPGQPAKFYSDTQLLDAARTIGAEKYGPFSDLTIRIGQMLSSDAFVTDANVGDTRQAFPQALSTDMETHAAAQVCAALNIPFVSIRAISDLCGKPDDQSVSFHAELDVVAHSAARIALEVLYRATVLDIVRSAHGPTQHFNKTTLKSALYLMLARRHRLEPVDFSRVPERVVNDLSTHLHYLPQASFERVLGEVTAGYLLAKEDANAALTAKDYDTQRTKIVAELTEMPPTQFVWPPTSQTIIKRFNGYWNDALNAIGLTPRRGRARGGLKYNDKDYLFAVRSYIVDAQHAGAQPSFNGYTKWLKDTGKSGQLPSGAAIRQRFGSWKEALAAAGLRPD
ncbi:MAG: 5'-methylthioadenosine/S-adenosylhomocysteine nucleosidase [Actinomycetaceae bacterium]|nr:5'-methylthioadenosine/S-adenosylhomocysteine nucleosidase [Actinomycetaceae bacterium]